MRRTITTAVIALTTATAAHAQPHPDRPFSTVSRIDPRTGSYSNSEYYYDAYTGLPTERGYWRVVSPAYPAVVYDPYPPAVVYYTPAYRWPPPPRVLAGRRWR